MQKSPSSSSIPPDPPDPGPGLLPSASSASPSTSLPSSSTSSPSSSRTTSLAFPPNILLRIQLLEDSVVRNVPISEEDNVDSVAKETSHPPTSTLPTTEEGEGKAGHVVTEEPGHVEDPEEKRGEKWSTWRRRVRRSFTKLQEAQQATLKDPTELGIIQGELLTTRSNNNSQGNNNSELPLGVSPLMAIVTPREQKKSFSGLQRASRVFEELTGLKVVEDDFVAQAEETGGFFSGDQESSDEEEEEDANNGIERDEIEKQTPDDDETSRGENDSIVEAYLNRNEDGEEFEALKDQDDDLEPTSPWEHSEAFPRSQSFAVRYAEFAPRWQGKPSKTPLPQTQAQIKPPPPLGPSLQDNLARIGQSSVSARPEKKESTNFSKWFGTYALSKRSVSLNSRRALLEFGYGTLESVLSVSDIASNFISSHCQDKYFHYVSFWLHVEQYRENATKHPDTLSMHLSSIYRRYIAPNSAIPLDFPQHLVDKIETQVNHKDAANKGIAEIFNETQILVKSRLEKDVLPKFLKSKQGQKYTNLYNKTKEKSRQGSLLPVDLAVNVSKNGKNGDGTGSGPTSPSSPAPRMRHSPTSLGFTQFPPPEPEEFVAVRAHSFSRSLGSPTSSPSTAQPPSLVGARPANTVSVDIKILSQFKIWQVSHPILPAFSDDQPLDQKLLLSMAAIAGPPQIIADQRKRQTKSPSNGRGTLNDYYPEVSEMVAFRANLQARFARDPMPRVADVMTSHPPPASAILSSDVNEFLELKFLAVDLSQIKDLYPAGTNPKVYVSTSVYLGPRIMENRRRYQTQAIPLEGSRGKWENETICTDLCVSDIPRTSRLVFILYIKVRDDEGPRPVAWVNKQYVGFDGKCLSGLYQLRMWPFKEAGSVGSFVGVSSQNQAFDAIELTIFFSPDQEVHFDANPKTLKPSKMPTAMHKRWSRAKAAKHPAPGSSFLVANSPLLRAEGFPDYFKLNDLPFFLLGLPFSQKDHVNILHRNLAEVPLPPQCSDVALRLLSCQFVDPVVRLYAVSCLEKLPEPEFNSYLMQLVQSLKYEPFLDSPLAYLLLCRAVKDPILGRKYFWNLRGEIEQAAQPWFRDRYLASLEMFLRFTTSPLISFVRQVEFTAELNQIATLMAEFKVNPKTSGAFQLLLSRFRISGPIEIPLYPGVTFSGLVLEECKVFDSKKKPMLLCLKSSMPTGPRQMKAIFKSGDDLRQDVVIIRLIETMGRLLQSSGLPLPLLTYECLSTGLKSDGQGYIEFVEDAATISQIQMAHGGSSAVFSQDVLLAWLQKHNPDPKGMAAAIDTFTASCAGYCVATYVLGIGDRHNDNIMLRKDGRLFHIDFGHFLGNVKRKFGIKRERTPFILTSDFVNVMEGGEGNSNFATFLEISTKAFLVVRRNSSLLLNLLSLMVDSNLSELKSENDLDYIRTALFLDRAEFDAIDSFRELIAECLRSEWATQVNWYLHNLKHR